MKLETFFDKFDQFADAPDAVAKMRELVLPLSANGAPHPIPEQRPRKLRRSAMFIATRQPNNQSSVGAA